MPSFTEGLWSSTGHFKPLHARQDLFLAVRGQILSMLFTSPNTGICWGVPKWAQFVTVLS